MNGDMRGLLPLALLAACTTTPRTGEPVTVSDSVSTGDGDGPLLEYRWEREGDWYVRGEQRVPAGLVVRLRELALAAPLAHSTPLPPALNINEQSVSRYECAIWEAAITDRPWLDEVIDTEIPIALVVKAARDRLLDPDTDTAHTWLLITLPGNPEIWIKT